MHTGMAEVCYCPVSLVYFQFLLLETLPPSLKLFYSIDHIAEAQGHHNLHLHQLAEVPHQPHSSRPLSRQHLTMSPLCGFSNPFRDQTLTKHPNCPSSFPKLTLCSSSPNLWKQTLTLPSSQSAQTGNHTSQTLKYTSSTLLWGSLLLFYPSSHSHSLCFSLSLAAL